MLQESEARGQQTKDETSKALTTVESELAVVRTQADTKEAKLQALTAHNHKLEVHS